MEIKPINSIGFKRKLKISEEAEYTEVLKKAKEKAAHGKGKSILIVPAMSLPQSENNNTGVGNIASKEAQEFFEFAKKYWGINEVQLLSMGHFFDKNDRFAIYSGTSMDLGNHVINLEDYVTREELERIVKSNKRKDIVNYSNIVPLDSVSEEILKDVFERITPETKTEFEKYKIEYNDLLETKSLFRALRELNGTPDFYQWNSVDKNLFNEDIVSSDIRNKRIAEIKRIKSESIEFYKFKNFLAEKSFQKGKAALNSKGIMLDGDIICGFAFEEKWASPKAFLKDYVMYSWGFPVLDINSPDAEKILRQKIRLYAKRYDNLRIDASWTYYSPTIRMYYEKPDKDKFPLHAYYDEKFLNIIDDEIKKVKGIDYDLKNVMHEFAADYKKQFNIYDNFSLKPSVKSRVKIYTSDFLSEDWGSADAFIKRGWGEDMFIIGTSNHDSNAIEYTKEQAKVLSRILKIPLKKLEDKREFIKAKFAEPMRAKNNMLFFVQALGLKGMYQHNKNRADDFKTRIPADYKKIYFEALSEGYGFNPMDALEKQFVAQGLDKKEPALFKKIQKFNKILAEKEKTTPWKKMIIGAVCISIILSAIYYLYSKNNYSSSK